MPEALEDILAKLGPGVDFGKDMRTTATFTPYQRCLRTISDSDYWSRLWIVQEYVICPCLRIASGRALLDIDAIFQRIDTTSGMTCKLAHNHLSPQHVV